MRVLVWTVAPVACTLVLAGIVDIVAEMFGVPGSVLRVLDEMDSLLSIAVGGVWGWWW
ncbi:hypothetical protein GCM10020001_068830 [Nonomuraea salmonea]